MNLILLTIDCLRADHLSCLGYSKRTTPYLDNLAHTGVLFSQAISVAPWTPPSFIGILTSTYPLMYGGTVYLTPRRPPVSQILQEHGYQTAAFHSNPWLSRYWGYNSGFSTFDDGMGGKQRKSLTTKLLKSLASVIGSTGRLYCFLSQAYASIRALQTPYAAADTLNSKAIHWLESNPSNFFLWIHYMDAHEPHLPTDRVASPSKKREVWKLNRKARHNPSNLSLGELTKIINLYDGEINYIDRAIGSLLTALEKRKTLDNTFVIVTADHGQQFMEHGDFGHGLYLYDEIIKVPLIINGPGLKRAAINEQVSLLDLAPTILDLLEVHKPDSFQGDSLVPSIMDRGKIKSLEAISEEGRRRRASLKPDGIKANLDVQNRKISLRTRKWKYIYIESGQHELYDLEYDPMETRNLIGAEPEIAAELKSKIMAHIQFEGKSTTTEEERIKAKITRLKGAKNI